MTRILISEDGPHSAEQWAEVTASQIVSLEATAGVPARKFELKVIEILEQHHAAVQVHERGKIKTEKHGRCGNAPDPSEHIEAALAEIVEAAKGTPFEAHFAKANVQAYLTNVLGQHFATSMQIERDWYLHPGEVGDAHRARHYG
ncbi:hypothetical protein K32_23900 [Kaistia sp. 32K]|uniref:hypothetical protein n=1 Tax=Kaistia sp. 32K TaxID=2795690 RepID=UPI0019166DAF|nr:hypothetical protein [Kaistia sp. 32K]BCP53773.1 hypothetical protein K32_23900 [Kaistia sp. 32K]